MALRTELSVCGGTFYRWGHEPQGIVVRSRDHHISHADLMTTTTLTVMAMTEAEHDSGTSMGYSYLMGNYPPRRTLSAPAAAILEQAHRRTGGSYRQVAAALGLSYPFWWRLCRGERAPSKRVAVHIIDMFGFDEETADMLIAESVDKRG